jgi:hypothetical protein
VVSVVGLEVTLHWSFHPHFHFLLMCFGIRIC